MSDSSVECEWSEDRTQIRVTLEIPATVLDAESQDLLTRSLDAYWTLVWWAFVKEYRRRKYREGPCTASGAAS